MIRENEKEFASKLLQLYALWATVPGDGSQKFSELTGKQMEILQKAYFPYIKMMDRAERDKHDLKLVEKLFTQFEAPEPPQRESLWEKKLKGEES